VRAINAFHIRLLLPLLARDRHRALARRMRQFASYERLSFEQNQDLQWQRFVKMLRHAYANTEFYRKRFDAVGFDPNSSFGPAEVSRVPALTRDDIRTHVEKMCSRTYKVEDLTISATGGTTDTPVKFYRDRESLRDKTALQLQLNTWAGMYPGDKIFHVWGARSDFSQNPSWRWRLYDRGLMRNVWAPTSLLNEQVSEDYRQLLNNFKPKIVYAYPTPLALFCEYMQASPRPVHRPEAVICTAEAVLDDQRKIIEETFRCRVFEHYGSREFGMIAAECDAHCGLHLASPAVFLEYLPLSDCEEPGVQEILVTDLLNYGMPLIRYRVNDCVVPSEFPCSCGRGYPLIKKIIGRTTDIFVLPDGSKVPGVALTNRVLQVCPDLKKTQVIQEEIGRFRLRYVPNERFDRTGLQGLKDNLKKFFPQDLQWEFEEVNDIQRESSGKTRFCISKVTLPSQDFPATTLARRP